MLHFVFNKESELSDFGQWTRLVEVLVLEVSEHFRVHFKFDCIIGSRYCLDIPFDIVIFFDTLDPLTVHLNEEINKHAETACKQSNYFPDLDM